MWLFVVILGVAAGLMDNDWPPTEALFLLAFIAFSLFRQQAACRIAYTAGLGILAYLYTNVYLAVLFDHTLAEYLYGQTLRVEGEVVEVLKQSDERQQIRFRIDQCLITGFSGTTQSVSDRSDLHPTCHFTGDAVLNRYYLGANSDIGSRKNKDISVSLFQPEPAEAGERWRLTVRLYPVRGFVNPGQSRYRLLQLAKGISARGYVRDEAESLRLASASSWDRWQHSQISAFKASTDRVQLPLVSTLLTGQSEHLSSGQWLLLQQTGTVHLVVVSGLHLGVLLGAGWLLLSLLPKIIPLDRLWQRLLLLITPLIFLLPMLLVWPSGVAISRALLMVLLVSVVRAKGVLVSPFRILILAVALLLISQPLYLLRPGFYYSVWAVGLLLILISGGRHLGFFLRIQLVLMAGLLPLQHFWLNTPDLVSGAVNLVAIPLVSLLILPLALMMVVSPFESLSALLVDFLSVLEPLFWQVLEVGIASRWGMPDFSLGFSGILILFALIWALPSLPGKGVVSLALVVALTISGKGSLGFGNSSAGSEENMFHVEIFDVGQGLSVAIQSDDRLLVYDTGPVFRSGFAPVAMILPPELRSEDRRIDLLVVSHDDQDHAGGLSELLPFSEKVLAGQPGRIVASDTPVFACFQGQVWRWGRVSIEVLYPPENLQWADNIADNDRSCVLRIKSETDPEKSLLLTGDIDSDAEQWLLSSGQDLSARWLVASHHGSAGGNSLAFLSAVSPEGVIYSAGYRNSYGHPAKKVQQRLAYLRSVASDSKRNIKSDYFPLLYREYNTADLGALKLSDSDDRERWKIEGQRESMPLRWLWRKLN